MRLMFIAAIASAAATASATAQTPLGQSGFAMDSSASIVSDYRFRGLSLSDGKPALQLEATLSHDSGFYAGAFTSSIAEYGIDADGDGARAEVDISGGWAFPLMGFDVDAGAMAYLYPDASDVNYYVLPVAISRAFGNVLVTAGFEYTPAQRSLADLDGGYASLAVEWASEFLPFSVTASVGHEDGAWAPEGKTDWSVGTSYSLNRFQLGLSYAGADDEDAGSSLIAALTSQF